MYILHKKNYIHFSLFFSADQKDLFVMVDHNLKVVTIAPTKTPIALINQKLKKNAGSVLHKQKYLQSLLSDNVISYTMYRYLGRKYVTCTIKSDIEFVKLYHGIVHIYTKYPLNKKRINILLSMWRKQRAYIKFNERLDECLLNFNIVKKTKFPLINLKATYLRRGFFYYDAKNYTLLLNLLLIKVPVFFIDYIIYYSLSTIASTT